MKSSTAPSTPNSKASQAELIGQVHSIETLGAVDGPGLRTVVFMQGCPLRCVYCHNVDCLPLNQGQDYTVSDLTKRLLQNSSYWHKPAKPWWQQAQALDGVINPETDASKEIIKESTSGGVTFSGGEPTLQSAFVTAVCRELKAAKIHIALDTSLFTSQAVIEKFLPLVDLWMVSLKHLNPKIHRQLTAVSNERYLTNLNFLDQALKGAAKLRLRVVVIPGYTASRAYAQQLAKFVTHLKSLELVELLPYQTIGKHKWLEQTGSYPFASVPEANKEDVISVAQALQAANIAVKY